MTDADGHKRDAAHAAVERFVQSGATVGLGSGTTSAFVVRRIGALLDAGELDGVRGVPTSEGTAALAREVGIPTLSLAEARPALTLGARAPVPVEVDPFGWQATLEALSTLGCQPRLRMDAVDPQRPFVTDGGHYTADCAFDRIADPAALETAIRAIPGALECGLFVGLARAAVVAGEGGARVFEG
jgi:ribose 5-phosphate isomerase A